MAIKTFIKGALAACVFGAFGASAATAQACDTTEFGSQNGALYLTAETELLVNDNAAAALQAINRLRQQELNCYEEGAVLRLSAAVKVESGDYSGAVQDLLTAIQRGFVPESERATTYYNISQLYMQDENHVQALEYMRRWIQAGGQPTRDQKWQLAVLSHKADDNRESLRWAEEVFRSDGPDAAREVYDFLIFLYDRTGQLGKKAQLLEQLLARNPGERRLWEAIAGDNFQAGNQRRAFEVQRTMYLSGMLSTEDEIMRIVNFYNQFDVPFQAAKILEKEMNAGRIEQSYDKLELLANLYQVAREFERAIPVIERAAAMRNSGEMYERLGRSFAELKDWERAEAALTQAINSGNAKDVGLAWVLIGQSRYERDNVQGAQEAFRRANNRGGRGWLQFIESERRTAQALECFDLQSPLLELENEQKVCRRLTALAEEDKPEGCQTVADRFAAAQEAWENSVCPNLS